MHVCKYNLEKLYRICNRLPRSLIVHSKEKVAFKVALTKYFTMNFLRAMMMHYIVFTKCI